MNKIKNQKEFIHEPIKKTKLVSGFTLIEIMASISVFAIAMLFVGSSVYGVFDSNRKSQSLRSVMDNLNFSLETMTRTIRFGNTYHCDISVTPISSHRDCASGASSFALLDSNGAQIVYRLSNGRITRSINGGAEQYVTSADVTITTLTFWVFGSLPYSSGNNLLQPRVIIVVSGYSGTKVTTQSSFSLQTTISQRQFDSQ